jgi:hypothetical protein
MAIQLYTATIVDPEEMLDKIRYLEARGFPIYIKAITNLTMPPQVSLLSRMGAVPVSPTHVLSTLAHVEGYNDNTAVSATPLYKLRLINPNAYSDEVEEAWLFTEPR